MRLYCRLVERLSFSGELYKLRRDLNARIDQPERVELESGTGPQGLSRWFKRRRISIAEAYLRVIRDLDSRSSKQRLRALKAMAEASFHTQALDMPLNTARVQMALIKEAVKHRSDHRVQLERLHDFSASSDGNAQAIRRLLSELDLVELPETGRPLRELGAGWDSHVHDTATTGRKNPTQLLIDAFIKGVSTLRIAYDGPGGLELMEEAARAGEILGIKVLVGIEIGLEFEGRRHHLMALLPDAGGRHRFRDFFQERENELSPVFKGLEADRRDRKDSMRKALEGFNERDLERLNDGFPGKRAYRLRKLKMRDLAAVVAPESATRTHLAELLWRRYRPVLYNRVLLLKAESARAARAAAAGTIGPEEAARAAARYARVREEYRTLSPERLLHRHFDEKTERESAFHDLAGLAALVARTGCGLRLIQPLEHGLARAERILEAGRSLFEEIEIYNVRDSIHRDPDEVERLCEFVDGLNARTAAGGKRLVPVVGSDSTGRNPDIPGMGFVRSDFLRPGSRYASRHLSLPEPVSRLVLAAGEPVAADRRGRRADIVCMGKVADAPENRIGDENDSELTVISPLRALRYLNPAIANVFFACVGFLVAERFVGPGYAALWLGITGFRNTIADLLAFRGARISRWSSKNVNWGNVAQSLFWTGFSVPIMAFIKTRFDVLWPFGAEEGLAFNLSKFFFISLANGLYLATHNTLRGFDRKVARANIFRSVIAWPFASAFAPVGNLVGIPSIVQAKLWSDVVAGFIEGGSKYFRTLRLRRRDTEEIVPRLLSAAKARRLLAVFDLLYLFREEPRARNSLAEYLGPGAPNGDPARLEALLEALSGDKLPRRLVDYAVSRYSHEVALDLVRLASETLPDLVDWLGSLRTRKPLVPNLARAGHRR